VEYVWFSICLPTHRENGSVLDNPSTYASIRGIVYQKGCDVVMSNAGGSEQVEKNAGDLGVGSPIQSETDKCPIV
jgi:hypothetical protein